MAAAGRKDGRFEVDRRADGSRALRALVDFEAGEILVPFRITELLAEPVRHSIQVGISAHALVAPEFLRFTNHSCDPNVVVDTAASCIRAIRRIESGDEITYFYPSTEWSMAEPFACACDAARCLLTIAGAAYLPGEVLDGYELAAHIRRLLADRRGESVPESAPVWAADDVA